MPCLQDARLQHGQIYTEICLGTFEQMSWASPTQPSLLLNLIDSHSVPPGSVTCTAAKCTVTSLVHSSLLCAVRSWCSLFTLPEFKVIHHQRRPLQSYTLCGLLAVFPSAVSRVSHNEMSCDLVWPDVACPGLEQATQSCSLLNLF